MPTAILAARTALGLSQAALARQLGVSIRSVSRWETGAIPVPERWAVALALMVEARQTNGGSSSGGAAAA